MSIRQTLMQQFKRPSGLLGRLAGVVMAQRRSNIARNQWMLQLMRLNATDKVLEIGHGPGLALAGALKTITHGLVVGLDHSPVMHAQARQRNANAIADGRLKLVIADIQQLAPLEGTFQHIFSANVVQFWKDPVTVFAHLRQSLAPGGALTTLYMPRNKGATSADAYKMADELNAWLRLAGFRNLRTETCEFDGLATICVIASLS
ncbi:MAG: class I SAM-dependent methyltransferase [Gammaproteobacteria bacterium]|nr:class I SAM-dependent methyltransferase [Gammaproteobacteria bacterium]